MTTQACGCCQPEAGLTPLGVTNQPGLAAIAYRIGTYASFRETMFERIAGAPGLSSLSSRQSDDYAITILELWAAVADVLTFYQERYANEVFLRTATQRQSISRLARLLDYHLRPGIAALARLAFTLDEGKQLDLPAGFKVQSVPGKDQQPQTFETIEDLKADARFNQLRIYPEPIAAIQLAKGRLKSTLDRLSGPDLAAAIAPNDSIILFNDGAADVVEQNTIDTVTTQDDRVIVGWKKPIQSDSWVADTLAFKSGRSFRLFGYNAPAQYMTAAPQSAGTPQRIVWSINTLGDSDYSYPNSDAEFGDDSASVLCLDGLYDGLAVGHRLLVDDTKGKKHLVTVTKVDQVTDALGAVTDTVTRLTVQPPVFPSQPVIEIFAEKEMFSFGLGSFGMNQVVIDQPLSGAAVDRRGVIVHQLSGPQITFWNFDYPSAITDQPLYLPGMKVVDEQGEAIEVGQTIERNKFKPGVVLRLDSLDVGRNVLLLDANAEPVLAAIKEPPFIIPDPAQAGTFCHLVLSLSLDSSLSLDASSAVLLGNVALASHGETASSEAVGSGDASQQFQRFSLAKKPLTYVPSSSAGGADSTLTLLVNGVRWKEMPGLYNQPATAQIYSTSTADDGSTVIQFGDGLTSGAALPTGRNNVTATYRVGAGLAGRVDANSLTTLLQKPTGLKSATNPLPADGGADPETIDHARQNAPLTVRTFGRAISLRDFEDLVTQSGEVAKAQATWVWDGLARAIYLTVAGQDGGTFLADDLNRLTAALTAARDPNHRLRLGNFAQIPVLVTANINVDPNYANTATLTAANNAVTTLLSFDNLTLGQPIHLSAIYGAIQAVAGAVSVDVTGLMFKKPASMSPADFDAFLTSRGVTRLSDGTPAPVQPHLRIFSAMTDPSRPGAVSPAEIAWIEVPAQDIAISGTGGL